MDDLFKKLNTLVRANAANLKPSLPRFERQPDLDRQVLDLRQRINNALEHEDDLQATVRQLRDTADQLDADADAALQRGDELTARRLLEQLTRAQQRLTIAQSDLEQHQHVVQELISRVNLLEATVADTKHAQAQTQDPPPPADATAHTDPTTDARTERISHMIRDAQERTREGIHKMNDMLKARGVLEGDGADTPAPQETESPQPNAQATAPRSENKDGEAEMQKRVNRLSKR